MVGKDCFTVMVNSIALKVKKIWHKFFYRSGWLRGCEIPVLVLFGARLIGSMNDNFISRCISNLVLVLKSVDVEILIPNDYFTVQEISGTVLNFIFQHQMDKLIKRV